MKPLRIAGSVLLLASVATNLLFLASSRSSHSRIGAPVAAPLVVDGGREVPPVDSTPAPSADEDLADCRARLPSLQAEAERLSQEPRDKLPPFRIFRLGTPNSEAEATLRPIVLAALSGDAGSVPDHVFECRDVVCRLTIVESKDAGASAWMGRLQASVDLRKRISSAAFHGSDRRDLLTRTMLSERRVYLRLVDADAGSAGMVR